MERLLSPAAMLQNFQPYEIRGGASPTARALAPVNYCFEKRSGVELRELDALGHVYHVNYLVFFENVRTAFWLEVKGESRLEALDFVMANVTIDFVAPVYFGDTLVSRLGVEKIGSKSLTLVYEVFSESQQQVVARGSSVQVAYDYTTRRSKTLEPELVERLEAYRP